MSSRVVLLLCMVSSLSGFSQKFEAQTIDDKISIGYGLAIGDVDGDKKPDILLADKKQFVWYRNGDWKKFVMAENLTEFDNVCIAARDINGDGKVEVAVGAQWNPGETSDTTKSGAVFYLIRPTDPTQKWTPIKLHHEPTVHRMKWVRVEGEEFNLVVVPLHGRGNKNGEGEGARIIRYEIPADPTQPWKYFVVDQSMHLTHNLDVVVIVPPELIPKSPAFPEVIYVGGKEGMMRLGAFSTKNYKADNNGWSSSPVILDRRSFGEVRVIDDLIAGISPMHGNELALHNGLTKKVIATDLNQGHGLAIGKFTSDAGVQVVAGWREPNNEKKVGIKIYLSDKKTETWKSYWIDDNGMACEDLAAADLDGDGKTDIIASGRSTHNLKIYWNKTDLTK